MAMTVVHNLNMAVDQPDYMALKHLGTGATKSTYADRTAVANIEDATITVIKPEGVQNDNWKVLVTTSTDNLAIFSFTATEFDSMMAKQYGILTMIQRDVREAQGWHQTIGAFTLQDSMNLLCWHISKCHTKIEDKVYYILVELDPNNWHSHCAMKRCNVFQRGYSTQFVQILGGHNYVLTQDEVNSMRVIRLDHYNPLQLSSRWTWSAGWLWAYSQPVNVHNAIQAIRNGEQSVMTILCQGIYNGGNLAIKMMPDNVKNAVMNLCVNEGLQIPKSNLVADHNIGHPDHQTWRTIIETEIDFDKNQDHNETEDDTEPRQPSLKRHKDAINVEK